jgi:hypothetical protein
MSESNIHNELEITGESTGLIEQFENNVEILNEKGELGVMFAILYKAAVEAEPDLSGIVIRTSGSNVDPVLAQTGGYAVHSGNSDSGKYEIVINVDDGLDHYERLRTLRRSSMEKNAMRLGIPSEVFDSKALAGFIFLHEIGHIVDFIKNAPDLNAHDVRRQADLDSLPIPKYNPVVLIKFLDTSVGAEWFEKAKPALEANFKVTTPEELIELQDDCYRSLPTEEIPDKFATDMIKQFL